MMGQQKKEFFKVTQIYPDSYFESEKYTAKIKQAKERLNLDGKIKKFVGSVQDQLRVRQSSSSPFRVKSESTKEILKKDLESKKQEEGTPNDNAINVMCENISIPRIKVLCRNKHKELCQKTTNKTSSNCINYESHKIMLLAQKRKTKLENMIKVHKLLIEDRRSLEQDVFAMRHTLDDLEHRISCSLQQLRNKKTFCENHGFLNNKNCKKYKGKS